MIVIIDYIFKLDIELRLKGVYYPGEDNNLLLDDSWCNYIGEKIEYVLGDSVNPKGGTVEIKNKFYKYQWLKEEDGVNLYLSKEPILKEFYEEIINYIPEGIQIYDKNGYLLNSNSASEILQNYNKDEFKGKHLLDIYDLTEDFSTVLSVLRTNKPVINRCDRFKMRNGKVLTTINSGYPVKVHDKLYGAVVLESDLSVLNKIRNRSLNLEAYIKDEQPIYEYELYTFDDIIHSSEKMSELIHFAKKVSLTNSSILIIGETGTGKELVAQSIHSFSPRRHKPFIDVNCSAIPSNLFESMFFGTEKGAFTGSINKEGFFEMADGGTLFLDEINSISVDMQAKLLRVLQEKRFQRVGGSKYIKCDVRIITAANENLSDLMEKQQFRRDFYYRISTIKINIPPLMERKEDIYLLVKYFLNMLCKEYDGKKISIDERTIDVLMEYDWPGNVRELQNVIEYAFNKVIEDKNYIEIENLPDYLHSLEKGISIKNQYYNEKDVREEQYYNKIDVREVQSEVLEERMKKLEKQIIKEVLYFNDGNITKSAKELGMSRQSLQYRIKKLDIELKN